MGSHGHQNNSPTGELLKLQNISLNYGQFKALKNIYLTLGYSEVHAIVGEHGAGKSSLGMIINGEMKPKSGTITFDGKTYNAFTLAMTRDFGIEMVHQQTCLNEYFTVAENLFLRSRTINHFIIKNVFSSNKKRCLKAATAILSKYDIDIEPLTPLRELNFSDRTLIDTLKHIYQQPRLLILDEALEKLSLPALNKILGILMELKQKGMSILFITHRIDDIYDFADRVSVIKNGEILVTDNVKNIDKINLIRMAYTQISAEYHTENLNEEFYQFLKYNEAILQHLPVNLIVINTENRIKMVNEYCKQYFRLENTPYLNLPLDDLFSNSNSKALKLIKDALLSREERTFYQVSITLDTFNTVNNIKTFPIYDDTHVIGNIIIIENVTEYDKLQKQLILSEKLASVGLLAAGVAHEINNPLEIIYNYLGYIKYKFNDQELHDTIKNLHEEISGISDIVSNLHAFSDTKKTINEEIEINDLIRNMLKLIQHNAEYKHIALHFESTEKEITINANKNEIKQVILNLLKNSFEAMPSGGEIHLTTSQISENGSHFVQITFTDTGPGIKSENPNDIFLPFYSTKKSPGNNLGLGLSVSYGIITKYNGTISVKNIDNSGCQFIIKIPQSV